MPMGSLFVRGIEIDTDRQWVRDHVASVESNHGMGPDKAWQAWLHSLAWLPRRRPHDCRVANHRVDQISRVTHQSCLDLSANATQRMVA